MSLKINLSIVSIYVITTFLIDTILSKQTERCPLYSTASLENKECLFKQTTYRFLMQECPRGTKCSVDPLFQKGKCVNSEYEYEKPAYPGGKCKVNSDCLSEKCQNLICVGSKPGDSCKSNSDCNFGLSCYNEICIYPKPKNANCNSTLECQMPFLCYNHQCTELFSYDNGQPMEKEFSFLCKSGKVYNNKCNNISNVNEYCDTEEFNGKCAYKDENETLLTINENCNCEYNSDSSIEGRKKCTLGNKNNEKWNKVLEYYKKAITPENIKKCNLNEKRPGFCRELLRNDWSIRKDQILLDKYIIESEYSNHLPSDKVKKEIIEKTLFGYDNTPSAPQNKYFKCPKYVVSPDNEFLDEKTCAYAVNPFNQEGNNITVYVSKTPCNWEYKCDYHQRHVYKNWVYNATCQYKEISFSESESFNSFFKSNPLQKKIRYPGESCYEDSVCLKGTFEDVGKCISGKCTGKLYGEECNRHSDCLLGNFCNDTTHQCQNLKEEGEYCKSNNDCLNNLLCMNNTCFAMYSLSNGTYLQPHLGKIFKSLCQYDFINEETNQCIGNLDYYNVSQEQIDEEGFVQCEIGEKCNYTSGDSDIIYTFPCQCGYNEEGLSFCPLSHAYREKDWKKYYTHKRKSFLNDCHTMKKFDCIDLDNLNDNNYYKIRTVEANLFHKSNSDIISILRSSYFSFYKTKCMIFLFIVYGFM